jgi:Virulence factor BrkB
VWFRLVIRASSTRIPAALLIIGAAGALNFLMGAPAKRKKPKIQEQPFENYRAARNECKPSSGGRGNPGEVGAPPLRSRFHGKAGGHLEKFISVPIADAASVNVYESEREQSRIIRRQFRGVDQWELFFEVPWKDIFWRTVNQASEDRLLAIAAGVVFYGLLALFPAVTALVSCYGLFAKPDSINDHLSFLQDVMPAEAYSIVQDQIARVIAKGQAGLGLGFAVGLVLAARTG